MLIMSTKEGGAKKKQEERKVVNNFRPEQKLRVAQGLSHPPAHFG